MEILTIKNKEIFICDSHNEVIEFWARHKESKPNIVSFDHHTDTRRAFQSEWTNNKLKTNLELLNGLKNGNYELICKLKHDEHIDAAIRCNFINKALLLTCERSRSRIKDMVNVDDFERYDNGFRIIVNPHNMKPEMSIETNLLKEKFKRFELCIMPSEWNSNYILDIDLDFFYKLSSIEVRDNSFFKEIIKGAKAISIAREEIWINTWRREIDNDLTVELLEQRLLKIIRECN